MRTIIAGSRGIRDYAITARSISLCGWTPSAVLCGMAAGPDGHGEVWASQNHVPIERYIPEWDKLGKRAGIARNCEMAHAAEALIAVWDGMSPGTRHMIEYARERGLRVFVHRTDVSAAPPPPVLSPAPQPPAGAIVLSAAPPPPLPATQSLYGQTLRAGLGVSTVLADIDFESYSEAGYVWDSAANKWAALPGAAQGKKGLPIVGAARYAEHPTAEVLCFAYDLKDGRGRRRWRPGMPNPADLFAHLAAGRYVAAWNASFEVHIWTKVCTPKYGWPPLQIAQVRCDMAKARAHALPGSLDLAAQVLGTTRKDPEGDRLMKKFSMPKNPTKKSPTTRLRPEDEAAEFDRYHDYNETDIVAEAEAAARIPDLSPVELEFWQVDQAINRRGVQVDRKATGDCIAIVNAAHEKYNAELCALTGGTVAKASELEKLKGWLGGKGLHVESLDADGIEAELADLRAAIKALAFVPKPPGAPTDQRFARYYLVREPAAVLRALEIREAIGSAAVKKLFALKNQMTAAGRVHDLFAYHGARTGRPTGSGPQPTNFPNSGPELIECTCGRHHGMRRTTCPWCGVTVRAGARGEEWNPGAVEDALEIIATRSLSMVEMFFGDAMAIVSGCLRGLFIARDGHRLICSDYSAIEAVGLAMLAGEQWRIDVFRTHGKIYEAGAAAITGIPFNEFMKHAGYTDEQLMADEWWKGGPARPGKHHPLRKTVGKVSELACFTARTQVLTDRGYVDMVGVLKTDKLWDGVEWVNHSGIVAKGYRDVLVLDGIEVTPNHPITCGNSWMAASKLVSNRGTLIRCLAFGSANLPSSLPNAKESAGTPQSSARAGRRGTVSTSLIYSKESQPAVTFAPKRKPSSQLKNIGSMPMFWQTMNTVGAYLIASLPRLAGAIAPTIRRTGTTVGAVFSSMNLGAKVSGIFSRTLSPLTAGTGPNLKWTVPTSTADTSRAISDLSRNLQTSTTVALWPACSSASLTSKPVFDIMNAGPRSRFTIRTASGHMVVHNSGYGGWIGAWKAFGADEFFTDDEIKKNIIAWRNASPAVVDLWGGQHRGLPWEADYRAELFGVEGAAVLAIQNPGQECFVKMRSPIAAARHISFIVTDDVMYCKLQSGRLITYHRPRLTPSTRRAGEMSISYEGYNTNPKSGPQGWVRMDTYGPKIVENINQAETRDIHTHALVNLEKAGYPVVLHVYDEAAAEVPSGFGSVEEFETIMADVPTWAKDWPVRASGGWESGRYRK